MAEIPEKCLHPGALTRRLAGLWVRLRRIDEQRYHERGWNSYAEKLHFKYLKIRLGKRRFEEADQIRRARFAARKFGLHCGAGASGEGPPPDREMTFKHSGSGGDIIYSLPAVKALSRGRRVKLYLNPADGRGRAFRHTFNRHMAGSLIPLLEHQPWISSVQVHQGEAVDYDLDLFRRLPMIETGRHSIAHWYFWVFAVSADLSQPWLELRPPAARGRKIVLARSGRYRNRLIRYDFLRDFGEIDFVGTPAEFQEMKQSLPNLRHRECADFLELARVIQGARFFIGNQSFPYACAEALKVRRILEICPSMPDVVPTGPHTGEVVFQENFEKLAGEFWAQTAAGGP